MNTSHLAAALLLSVSGSAAAAGAVAPPALELPPDTRVELEAERLVREPDGLVRATGDVRLTAGPWHLRADEATYDPETGRAETKGRVTLVSGKHVARAARVSLELRTGEGVLEDAVLFEKAEPVPPAAALAASDLVALAALGKNRLDVRAERIVRLADGGFVAHRPTVTTCDCDGDPPTWRIGAAEAAVAPGESVRLTWPVLYARDVPLAALPYVSLPLARRKTGLLAPQLGYSGRRGASYEQPVFVVLGEHADATVEAGYFTGVSEGNAFEGPKTSLELRWAPRRGSTGRAFASYAYDLSERGLLPHRTAVELSERDEWGEGLADRLGLSLVSDRTYVSDFTDDVTRRGEQSLRSTAWVGRARGEALVVVDGVLLQDLRPAVRPLPGDLAPEGLPPDPPRLFGEGARRTFQRLPELAADVIRVPVGDLGSFRLHASGARFGPLSGPAFADEGPDGLGRGDLGWVGADAGEGDGVLQGGELPAATRLALRPDLSIPIRARPWLALTPYAGWREQIYAYEPGGTGSAGYGVFGAVARTELSRTSGPIRHAIVPALELRRLVPGPGADAPPRPYDELDLAPGRAVTQGRAAVLQRLDAGRTSLSLGVGEEARLAPTPGGAEAFATARLASGPAHASALVRLDPSDGDTTEVAADAVLKDGRGDQVRAGWRRLSEGGSARLRAGPDELLADAPAPAWLPGIHQVGAGTTVVLVPGLSARYDLLYLATLRAVIQQTAGLAYVSRCSCWGAEVSAALRRSADGTYVPDVGFTADLGGLVGL